MLSDTLSFSKTAKRLNIAQPAVSIAIKKLEEQLGVQLFLRQSRKVVLTQEGYKLRDVASGSLRDIEYAISILRGEQKSIQGKIRIGCLQELGELVLAGLVKEFSDKFPNIQFDIIYSGNFSLLELLRANEIDIMFGIATNSYVGIQEIKLLKQESFLVTNSKTKVPSRDTDLLNQNFAAYHGNDPLLLLYLKSFFPKFSHDTIHLKYTCNSHKTMVDFIIQNKDLYAVFPQYSQPVYDGLLAGRIKKVRNHSLSADIIVYYWEKSYMQQKMSTFIDHVRAYNFGKTHDIP